MIYIKYLIKLTSKGVIQKSLLSRKTRFSIDDLVVFEYFSARSKEKRAVSVLSAN